MPATRLENGSAIVSCCLAITPNGKTIYVISPFAPGTVTPVSTARGKAGKPVKVGLSPESIAIRP